MPADRLAPADYAEGGMQLIARRALPSWRFLVNECAKAAVSLTYTGIYRTLEQQHQLWDERKGVGVALPGTSMHGWGLAVDVAVGGYGSAARSIDARSLDVLSWIITAWELPWAWEGTIAGKGFEAWHLNYIDSFDNVH